MIIRVLALILLALVIVSCDIEISSAYSGSGAVWLYTKGAYTLLNKPGNNVGIQEAVDRAVSTGAAHIQVGPGRFSITTTVSIAHGGVTIIGSGDSTVFVNDGSVDIFEVNASGVKFMNFSIDGRNHTTDGGRGIDVVTGSNITVENVLFLNSADACVSAQSGVTGLKVINCRMLAPGDASSADGYGVVFSSSTDGLVDGCYIENSKLSAVYGFSASHRLRIVNNEINTGRDNGIRFEGLHTVVSNNLIYDVDVNGIRANGDSSTVTNNNVARCNNAGIYTNGVLGGLWSGNTITQNGNSGMYVGHETKSTIGLRLEGNYSAGNIGAGITLNPSTTRSHTNVVLANNQLLGNTFEGIRVAGATLSSNAAIYGNYSQGNTVSDVENLSFTNWTYVRSNNPVGLLSTGVTFANLGTPANGTIVYCTDCNKADPCTSGGTGAFAKREAGAWDCN